MKSKGFCYKLQDTEKTMFITNLDVSNAVKFAIINRKYDGLYSNAIFDSEFVIPRKEFIELCNKLNETANDMNKKKIKEEKFIADFETDLSEMVMTTPATVKRKAKK